MFLYFRVIGQLPLKLPKSVERVRVTVSALAWTGLYSLKLSAPGDAETVRNLSG